MSQLNVCNTTKKARAFIITIVDHETRCVVGHAVYAERTPEVMQAVIDSAPHATSYLSDAFNTYGELCWWGEHRAMYDKSQTYSGTGDSCASGNARVTQST